MQAIGDLQPGMMLEGVVTNVANFGAFVDIGVHQDGLVHVSQLADRFVKDPRDVVKAGDIVKVRVVEVDLAAQAHRADDEAAGAGGRDAAGPSQDARSCRGTAGGAAGRDPDLAWGRVREVEALKARALEPRKAGELD